MAENIGLTYVMNGLFIYYFATFKKQWQEREDVGEREKLKMKRKFEEIKKRKKNLNIR